MQAVKMLFKPLQNSSHDIDITIELASRLKAIAGGKKGYTLRDYTPAKSKKPQKAPCNTVVYIRMYTTIASRLKGYTKKQGQTLRGLAKIAYFADSSRHPLTISIFNTRLQETVFRISRKFQKVVKTVQNKGIRSEKISPSAAFCENPEPSANSKNNINPLLHYSSITCIIKIDNSYSGRRC